MRTTLERLTEVSNPSNYNLNYSNIILDTLEHINKDELTYDDIWKLQVLLQNIIYRCEFIYSKPFSYDEKLKENTFKILDINLGLIKRKYINFDNLFILELNSESRLILDKYKINYKSQDFLEYKFLKKFKEVNNNSTELGLTSSIKELLIPFKLIKNKDLVMKKIVTDNIIGFGFCLENKYNPSIQDCKGALQNIWHSCYQNQEFKINAFCKYFSETNVFINSLAPSNKLDYELKKFFKEAINNNTNKNKTLGSFALSEDRKKEIFFNHPSFLNKNFENSILRKDGIKYLNKPNLNSEDKEQVFLLKSAGKKEVKKIKI